MSCHIISYHIVSYHTIYRIIYHIVSYIVSHHVSYHPIVYHTIYHIMYHIISYIISIATSLLSRTSIYPLNTILISNILMTLFQLHIFYLNNVEWIEDDKKW